MPLTKDKNFLWIILFCLAIFILSFLIHWYPIQKKGYPPSISPEALILARNLALTGEYKSNNAIGTVLSSELIKKEGDDSLSYNKLTVVLYSYFFKAFGYNQTLPLYISLLIYSLVAVILFILTYRLFNLNIALLQSLIFVFLPIINYSSVFLAFYEWGVLFFSLGLLFYLITKKDQKLRFLYLVLAGSFLTAASLARSAFILSVFMILVYEFFKHKDYRRIIVLFLPLIIGWSLYLVPDILNNRVNSYISDSQQRFGSYGHLFPDPYTFYFAKDEFLNNLEITSADNYEVLIKLGEPVSLKDRVLMYFASLIHYPAELLRIIVLGGPLILALLIFGLNYLIKNKKDLAKFFIVWIVGWYLLLIILKTNNGVHLLEIIFPLSLLIALGSYQIINYIKNSKRIFLKDKLWVILFILFLTAHLILANKWMYHEEYNTSNYLPTKEVADVVKGQQIGSDEVIAVNHHPKFPYYLNYFTDKSYIHFGLETIERLLEENKLSQAFEKYQVKYIIGFGEELSRQIKEQTSVKIID